jgi:tetratricopeptide (TPR) repeat protein
MNEGPDFTVDPSGDVQDVRGQKTAQESHSAQSRKPKSSNAYPDMEDIRYEPPSTSGGKGDGIILIPIGLIITAFIFIVQFLVGRQSNNSFDPNEISSGKMTFSEEAVQAVDRGLEYSGEGDFDHAIEQYGIAIRADPQMPESYNDRGVAYFDKGEIEKAIADLDHAIRIAPKYAAPYNNRGLVYSSQGEHEKGLADFNKAIELEPRFGKAYFNRALEYYNKGDYDNAITDISKAIELASEFKITYLATLESIPDRTENSFYKYMNTRLEEEELADAQISASLPEAYQMRALAYLQKGEFEKAEADFNKASELSLDTGIPEIIIPEILSTAWPPEVLGEEPTRKP